MLVQCPKCGFSQPKDAYCAKCGVDMDNFHPTKKPKTTSIWQNPIIHIALLVGLVFGVTHFIQFNEKSELKNRISLLKGEKSSVSSHLSRLRGNFVARESKDSTSETGVTQKDLELAQAKSGEATTNPSATEEPSHVAINDNENSRSSGKTSDSGLEPERVPSSLEANTSEGGIPRLKVNVIYAEVKSDSLERLYQASGDQVTAVAPDGSFLRTGKTTTGLALNSKVLEKVNRSFSESRSPQWFLGAQDPSSGSALGFTTSVYVEKEENDILSGQIEVVRALIDPETNQLNKRSYLTPFSIYANQAMLLSGLLPVTGNVPDGQDFLKQTLLRVLFSSEFQSKQSQFVIFFEFQRE